MKIQDFDYNLPSELIAQTPLAVRSDSRLLVMDRHTGAIDHQHFNQIVNYLDPSDVLVLNDTKVIPARLIGYKEITRAQIELLLLKNIAGQTWECLAKPAKRLKVGTIITFEKNLKAQVTTLLNDGLIRVELIYEGNLYEILDQIGQMPLPPYIHQQLNNNDRYQTIYAKNIGSAAAPTAGFHFTPELLNQIKEKGITILHITLHVGLGTFRPVQVTNIEDHIMHAEYYEMSSAVAEALNKAKKDKKRIIAVGTTSARTLEAVMQKNNQFKAGYDETDIFIYPGYKFKAIDALITNFHLPKSTLLMLVSALAGKENILRAYDEAIKQKYRFFSFGDAMFIKGDRNED